MADVAKDHNEEWRQLGVAVLHRLIIADLLGCTDLPKPTYVHLVEEVVTELKTGEYPLAALVMPATVDHVRQSASAANACRPRARISIRSCLAGWSLIRWNSNANANCQGKLWRAGC